MQPHPTQCDPHPPTQPYPYPHPHPIPVCVSSLSITIPTSSSHTSTPPSVYSHLPTTTVVYQLVYMEYFPSDSRGLSVAGEIFTFRLARTSVRSTPQTRTVRFAREGARSEGCPATPAPSFAAESATPVENAAKEAARAEEQLPQVGCSPPVRGLSVAADILVAAPSLAALPEEAPEARVTIKGAAKEEADAEGGCGDTASKVVCLLHSQRTRGTSILGLHPC